MVVAKAVAALLSGESSSTYCLTSKAASIALIALKQRTSALGPLLRFREKKAFEQWPPWPASSGELSSCAFF